jgi:activator of HSP90 ATPase
MVLHNPNNWHWVDKNCLSWARTYFNEKLVGLRVEEGDSSAEITGVRSCDGDVDVNQRKGKVISLFDVNMILEYSGKTKDEDNVTGLITIPEISYDSSEEDYEFRISINSETASKEPVKVLVRQKLVPKLRTALAKFGPDLIETHGRDIQHEGQDFRTKSGLPEPSKTPAGGEEKKDEQKIVGTAAYNTTTLKLEPVFSAPAEQLYDAFLKPEMVAAWSRSKPDIAPEVGKEYSLFNGNVTGKILSLDPGKNITMTWRLRDWKQGHFAKMSLDFVQGAGETTIKVNWTGIPVGQEEIAQNNFEEYYVKSIKLTFGFGTVL